MTSSRVRELRVTHSFRDMYEKAKFSVASRRGGNEDSFDM